MTIREAKEIDMVDYLAGLGHKPAAIKGHHYWYHSPLRDEKTPSFKVNRQLNRWYDWGEGRGGNLVDFGVLYHKCSAGDFLHKLTGCGITQPTSSPSKDLTVKEAGEKQKAQQIQITKVEPLHSVALLRYLQQRRIPVRIADKYCREVSYELNAKNYFAIGFKNNAGGYELRNPYVKAASTPKGITFIDNGAKELATFEGFFNFLSHQALYDKQQQPDSNYLILNSTSFFEKSLPLMQSHASVRLFLDNDKTGEKFTQMALATDKEKFIDERKLYSRYDDVNDFLVNMGQTPKQQLRQKL